MFLTGFAFIAPVFSQAVKKGGFSLVNYEELGNRIRFRRQFLGLTQKEIAARINVAPSYFSNIERGLRIPSVDTLVAIANALDTGVDILLVDSLTNAIPRRSAEEMRVIQRYLREEILKIDPSTVEDPSDLIRFDD